MRRIKDAAEESKILLSGSESVEIRVPYIKTYRDKLENIVCTVSRAEFEAECAPFLCRMEKIIEQVLHEAGLAPTQANIWLLGNASRMPAISRHLRRKFSVKPPGLSDLKTSVALGAAKVAATLKGLDKNLLLLDVTPRALGIPTRDGDFESLIEKNTTIPTKTPKTFVTVSDNQTSISVPVLEESERASESHRIIGTLKMDNIPARRAGVQKIEVAFEIDPNNILHVSAKADGFKASSKSVWNFFARKKEENPIAWDGKTANVTCNDFELPAKTLNQYRLLVQDWTETRRKRWPKPGS
jgi:molecular chaperone DnaK